MIMTSLETMTNTITSSNVSKLMAALMLQITFENGRCFGDLLRKHINIILLVDEILRITRIIDFGLTTPATKVFFLTPFQANRMLQFRT